MRFDNHGLIVQLRLINGQPRRRLAGKRDRRPQPQGQLAAQHHATFSRHRRHDQSIHFGLVQVSFAQQELDAHMVRHTFAIQFLRNGGNVFALQKMLGNNSLEMCKRYLALVEDDLKAAMQTSSPADRWRL